MQEKQNLAFSDQLITERKVYLSPEFSVMEIEMEQGIAAGSAQINPATTGQDGIATDWDAGSGDQTDVVTWE